MTGDSLNRRSGASEAAPRLSWPMRLGLATDRLLNVALFDGNDTMTISRHAAAARLNGKRWGCVVCAVLGALVQRNHCAITLDPNQQETTGAAAKAGALMALVIGAIWLGLHVLIRTLT